MTVFAFDFFDTLTHHEDVRELARRFHAQGNEIHIVSAITPGYPQDNDEWYSNALVSLKVPFTKIHRVDHKPSLKVEVLRAIRAEGFWDNDAGYVAAARAAGIPSCHVGVEPHGETSVRRCPTALEVLYQKALKADAADPQSPSDISEHLPLLRDLAGRCEHITEFGMRRGNGSTLALLAGQPETFITWDILPWSIISQQSADLLSLGAVNGVWSGRVGRTSFEPRVGDTLKIVIEPTDLLFIDTLHTYKQLFAELMRHADPLEKKVRKYLVFHDTHTFGWQGEDGTKPGLRTAIWHFQKQTLPQWGVKYDWSNNNGLLVLERADVSDVPGIWPDEGKERFR